MGNCATVGLTALRLECQRVLAMHRPSLADIIIILVGHVFYNPASGSGGARGGARGAGTPRPGTPRNKN